MVLNLLNVLNCDAIFNNNQLTVITSEDINSSIFIIDTLLCFVNSKIKSKENEEIKVFLISINQNWLNYSIRLSKRFGVNLKHLNQLKCFETLDLLGDFEDYLKKDKFDWVQFKENIFTKMYSLFDLVQSVKIMIIDDITCLLNFTTFENLYLFLLSLRSVCFELNISLIIQSSIDYDNQDEEVNKIVYSLIDCSQEWIEVKKLKTGHSFKIDGQLIIYKYTGFSQIEKNCYQFKHSDRNVQIFPFGYQL